MLDSDHKHMIFSREYVGYLGRKTVQHLVDQKLIKTAQFRQAEERVTAALLEELSLEDRINDEVRIILEQIQEDMRRSGAEYGEMFKKVKQQLVRKYKVIL